MPGKNSFKYRPRPKRNKHPWKTHQPELFKSHFEDIDAYDQERFTVILKKKVKKDGRGPMVHST
jgi:hypothetical protein